MSLKLAIGANGKAARVGVAVVTKLDDDSWKAPHLDDIVTVLTEDQARALAQRLLNAAAEVERLNAVAVRVAREIAKGNDR